MLCGSLKQNHTKPTKPSMLNEKDKSDSKIDSETEMEKRQKKIDETFDCLLEDGHACIMEVQTYPSQLEWCQEQVCVENSEPLFKLKDLPRSIQLTGVTQQAGTGEEKVEITRLRHDTCFQLCGQTWQNAVMSFMCDLCECKTDPHNPIYTHPDHEGVDVCSECLWNGISVWVQKNLTLSRNSQTFDRKNQPLGKRLCCA